MKRFSLTLTFIFAAFLTAQEEAEVVNCNTSEGWACSIWDQNHSCRGCSKTSIVRQQKIQPVQE